MLFRSHGVQQGELGGQQHGDAHGDEGDAPGRTEAALDGEGLGAQEFQVRGRRPRLDQVVTPCSLCYVNLRKTQRTLDEDEALRARVDDALAAGGLRYRPGRTSVRHLLDVVVNDVGLAKLTVPGPLIWLQEVSSGAGLPSSLTVPTRVAALGSVILWSTPASAVGA